MERPQLAHQAEDIQRRIDGLRTRAIAFDSSTPDKYFIPRRKLAEVLSPNRIKILLEYHGLRGVNCDIIHYGYLAVLGTLTIIHRTEYITYFTRYEELSDAYLPFHDKSWWSRECHHFFEEFESAQWQFCSQEFHSGELNDVVLRPGRILPFIDRKIIKKGPNPIVEQIEIHPDYNLLHAEVSTRQDLC